MPDLDFLFEIGPQLEYRLLDVERASGARMRARFTADLRAVFSSDFGSVEGQGFVADVGIGLNVANFASTGMTFITSLESSFATERLQDYFYEVDPQFVTDTRAAFGASGGYLESSLTLGVAAEPLPQLRVFAGTVLGLFDGASNQDSPLFEVTTQMRFALGVVWTIQRSKQMVDIVELGTNN